MAWLWAPRPRGGRWPRVSGLNQVFGKFRWSGTKWLFSAQFKMIGLAPPCSSPFRSTTDFMTTKKQLWVPLCQPSRCFPREERSIYKVPSTSCSLQNSAQETLEKMGGGMVFIISPFLILVSEICTTANTTTSSHLNPYT